MKNKTWLRYGCWIAVLSGWANVASAYVNVLSATASSEWSLYKAQNTIDESGMSGDQCSNVTYPNRMWGTDGGAVTGWIKFDLGARHSITNMRLWNANETGYINVGVKYADILVSPTGAGPASEGMGDWTVLIEDQLFTQAPGTSGYVTTDSIALSTTTRYIALDCSENYGSSTRIGFGEVRFYGEKAPFDSGLSLITGVTATASSEWSYYKAVNAVDDSGMTGDLCSNITYPNKMWGTDDNEVTGWIKFDLGALYAPSFMRVWNANETGYTHAGVKYADILVSPTGVGPASEGMGDWTVLISSNRLIQAPGTNGYVTVDDIPLDTTTRYIALDCLQNYGYAYRIGLCEVRFYGERAYEGTVISIH
ncbi:MAG: hypothetical protein HQ523_00640 [Lentisphaerae bacterium]|nr:hypothetical protein [Lentisphaerota bacterium]